MAAAAAATSLQLCPTLCDPIDGSPPGSPIPGILQARTLEWVVISFPKGSSQARDRTHVSALQADTLPPKPPGKPPIKVAAAAAKLLQSCPTLCNPIDGSPPGSLVPGILQARTLEWVAIAFSSRLSKELLFTEALPRWGVCAYVCACSVNLTL